MTIPLSVAELIGTSLETFGYGVYVIIFPKCLDILRKKDVKRGLMSYLLATMWISFALITVVSVSNDLIRAFTAFAGSMDLPGSPEKYYANANTSLTIAKIATYVSETLLADILLVYRTYIVCGRKFWVVILPALLLGLDAVMSVWLTLSVYQTSSSSNVLASTSVALSKYFFIVTLALNLLCTFLIGLRIWDINHKLRSHSAGLNRRDHVLSSILESTAIYTAILVGLIATSIADSSAGFLFLNLIPPVIGSVFSYVVIRCSTDNKPFDTRQTGSDNVQNRSGEVIRLGRVTIGHEREHTSRLYEQTT